MLLIPSSYFNLPTCIELRFFFAEIKLLWPKGMYRLTGAHDDIIFIAEGGLKMMSLCTLEIDCIAQADKD